MITIFKIYHTISFLIKVFNRALDISLQNFLYKNIIRDLPPGGRWLGAFEQGADSLEHLARGQIAWSTLSGGRWLGAFEQGADSLEYLDTRHMGGSISPEA